MKKIFHIGTEKITTLLDLYIDQLRDLYSAETQLVEALPKMAEAATDPTLKKGFETHLEETKGHVDRIEIVFAELDEEPEGKTCQAMVGLIKEGKEAISEKAPAAVKDAALIAAAQRVEHYEIAAYGTVRAYAGLIGQNSAIPLLQATLDRRGRDQ